MGRKLYHIPAWHNRVDWSIDKPPKEHEDPTVSYMRKMPPRFWQEAELFWDIVDEAFADIHVRDWTQVRIFSDTTWETSPEEETFIRNMAKQGSRHMQVVVKLLERGATLEVTEEMSLFIGKGIEEAYNVQLDARDKAIAHNINMRLQADEIGFLLLGMSHKSWERHLDVDIVVEPVLKEEHLTKCAEL